MFHAILFLVVYIRIVEAALPIIFVEAWIWVCQKFEYFPCNIKFYHSLSLEKVCYNGDFVKAPSAFLSNFFLKRSMQLSDIRGTIFFLPHGLHLFVTIYAREIKHVAFIHTRLTGNVWFIFSRDYFIESDWIHRCKG